MDTSHSDLEAIRQLLADLTRRVYRIERKLGLEDGPTAHEPVKASESVAAASLPPPPPRTPAAPIASRTPVPEPKQPHTPPQPPYPLVPDAVAHTEPDLESRIGSHWLNRIGIAALLIGVSYFLKYAFENNWIGPAGRVTIGLLAGVAVVVWSERFRSRGYRTFCAGLMIIGLWRRSAFVRWQALVLIAATIVKVFIYDVSELDRAYRILSFIVLGALLLAISFVYQRNWLQLSAKKNSARA
jgi:uncharacterized membrane protein